MYQLLEFLIFLFIISNEFLLETKKNNNQIKIGRYRYTIKYPTLHSQYNALYSITHKKIYYGCPKSCNVCKKWNKKNQIWKVFSFFPIHCHFCQYAGNKDDFELENIFIICKNCHETIKKEKKNLFKINL